MHSEYRWNGFLEYLVMYIYIGMHFIICKNSHAETVIKDNGELRR